MTREYVPGQEDIQITVSSMPGGFVRVGIYRGGFQQSGVVLAPDRARDLAAEITMCSYLGEGTE